MKKIIIVSLSLLILFGFSLTVFAEVGVDPALTDSDITDMSSVIQLLDDIIDWFFGIVIAIAVFMLLFAGFTWITSGGNEEKLGTARKMLIYALVGIAIAFVAKGLVSLVANLVGANV